MKEKNLIFLFRKKKFMINEIQQQLITIVKNKLHGLELLDNNTSQELLILAQKHSLAHLIGGDKAKNIRGKQTAKIMMQEYELTTVIANCEKQGIYILPVKGICTRKRYKDEYIRSMGDMDILYRVNQNEQLKEIMNSLGYEWLGESQKHDHYVKKPFVNIEMHRELVAADSDYASYYENIWERCHLKSGYSYVYEMTVEDEFIFNIVHLTEHFKSGGIGVRLIMDVYVYNHLDMDFDYVHRELRKLKLYDFFCNISMLAELWFGDDVSRSDVPNVVLELEEYVFDSGLYGNHENISALAVSGGRGKRFLRMCFPGYKGMKSAYTWLDKWPFLLPVAWVIRGFRVLFSRRNTLKGQLALLTDGEKEKGRELREFYKECGL